MLEHEDVALAALKMLMGFRRSQAQITREDIEYDVTIAHMYAEHFMAMIPPPVPKPQGF
jgi:hypothetical protein